MSKQENVSPIEGHEPDTSELAVAERIRSVLGTVEPDLAAYLIDGDKTVQMLQAALADAEEMVSMFGCAMIGAPEHYGGPPADTVISEWTYLVERKVRLARDLAEKVREGGRHE